ncbi:MAG: Biotin/lipoate protein ligase [Bacteroidetes bacterium]|nr:Biotin/lipoate protein ligase [Bacteroidota bacterium]
MRFLDLTYPTPAENLACDEALLDQCDDRSGDEALRFWESPEHFVVLGFSGRLRDEVREEVCAARGIPVLRRVSGGGTVVQGPGVLNYAVVIRPGPAHEASSVRGAHRFVLGRAADVIASLTGEEVKLEGDSDLAIAGRKISGNAQRRRGRAVLVHGTILLGLDLALVEDLLPLPGRAPEYRETRGHLAFLRNLNLNRDDVKQKLRKAWDADEEAMAPTPERMKLLVELKYGTESWRGRR